MSDEKKVTLWRYDVVGYSMEHPPSLATDPVIYISGMATSYARFEELAMEKAKAKNIEVKAWCLCEEEVVHENIDEQEAEKQELAVVLGGEPHINNPFMRLARSN